MAPIPDSSNDECARTISSPSVKGIAEYIKTHKAKRIVMMVGAGISTSAGIPDFRSAGTGLYSLLGDYNLPEPEDIFDITFFNQNPRPFYRLALELLPGKFRPTISHSFIRLLEAKGLLSMCYTQNIDTLERTAGVSDCHLVEAHGSFNGQKCSLCRQEQSQETRARLLEGITNGTPVSCEDRNCGGFVKPSIVFFGEPLPSAFFDRMDILAEADLAIIMGTSLSVYPFAGLPQSVPYHVPRLLINNEAVGDIGARPNDAVLLADCDTGVRLLAKECGWLDELEEMWARTELANTKPETPVPTPSKDQIIESEILELQREVDRILLFEKSLKTMLTQDKDGTSGDTESLKGTSPSPREPVMDEIDELAIVSSSLSIQESIE